MSESSSVRVEVDGPVGSLILDRAERHNAFDEAVITGLLEGIARLEREPRVRAVVLGAEGESFCAGADLNWMKRAAGYGADENLADARRLAELLRSLNELGKPTVAKIQGPAYGGGVGLVAACDIAISSAAGLFSLSEVKLGLIPAVISPYVMAKIGETNARRYFLTAERFSAERAHRIGLVHDVVADSAALEAAVGEVIQALLKNGPRAMGEAKRLVRSVAGKPLDAALNDYTARRITEVRSSEEGREGIAAFLEKRPPSWLSRG